MLLQFSMKMYFCGFVNNIVAIKCNQSVLWVYTHTGYEVHKTHNSLIIRATIASMITAMVIIAAKLAAWLMTGSSAVLAALVDSILDSVTSLINFLAARYALQPPDQEHRFGHGKAEDLAVLVQSSFFLISGVVVTGVAIKKIIVPEMLDNSDFGMICIAFSLVVSICLLVYQSYVIKHTASNIVKADRLHYIVDLFTNASVVISIFLSARFHCSIIDPIFAIGISAFMMREAWKMFSGSFRNLMDHEFSNEDKKKLREAIMSHPEARGFHDVKTRYSGSKPIIQFHLEMDGKVSLYEAHRIAEEVEMLVIARFRHAEVIIHQDPEDITEIRQFDAL